MNAFLQFLLLVTGITAIVVIAALLLARSMRWAKNRPSALGSFGWALLFYSTGRMPPPPPKTHIEQETRAKRNRETGRDEES